MALTPDGRWECSTVELIEAASRAGFAALGLPAGRYDRETSEAYRRAGLRCHEVLALIVDEDEEATVGAARPLAEVAAALSTDWVLTVFRSPLNTGTAATIRRCATMFAEAGSGMAVEFSPLGPIGTMTQAMEVVDAVNEGAGRAALVIDSWHFFFGESTWDDLGRVPLDSIAYIQFTDALAPESGNLGRETMHRRALPGEGGLDLGRFAHTLLERGYEGTVSVEVLSAELRTLPVDEIARQLHAAASSYWR